MNKPYLEKPIKIKQKKSGTNRSLSYCAISMQGIQIFLKNQIGWKKSQEDFYLAELDINQEGISIFAIFDGHGGDQVAEYLATHFVPVFSSQFNQNIPMTLELTFKELDQKKWTFVGSTANVVIYYQGSIWVANIGDSRCILSRKSELIELSKDHRPYDIPEWERIEHAGGWVDENGRLNGTLAMSRALGDHEFKSNEGIAEQLLSAQPDITKINIQKGEDFLLIASDGVFEIYDQLEVMQFIESNLKKQLPLEQIMESLMDKVIARDTKTGYGCDNISGVLIKL